MEVVDIICFAKSRKYQGYCIAGKRFDNGRWFRPVSTLPCGALARRHVRCNFFFEAKPLDIVSVPVTREEGHYFQTENMYIAENRRWKRKGRLPWHEVARYLDSPETLWLNGFFSAHGKNDRIPDSAIRDRHIGSSLYLIQPEFLRIGTVETQKGPKVRAYFRYNGDVYNFTVTDPKIEKQYGKAKTGTTLDCQDLYLCVSLGEVYEGSAYKLVACVLEKP